MEDDRLTEKNSAEQDSLAEPISADSIELRPKEISAVIYVEDRPLRALFKHLLVAVSVAVLALAGIGFYMGLIGAKTPHVSDGVIGSQVDKLTGQSNDEPRNELEKNP